MNEGAPAGIEEQEIQQGVNNFNDLVVSDISDANDPTHIPQKNIETTNSQSSFIVFDKTNPKNLSVDLGSIETQLNAAIDELGHFPTQRELARLGRTGLSRAVGKSGGFGEWRRKLGFEEIKKVSGYWQDESNIENEVLRIMNDHQLTDFPTLDQLADYGETSVGAAIGKTGGYSRWRDKLGFELKEKPKKYWTSEAIEAEARNFLLIYGGLSQALFSESKRYDLQVAISRRYKGGLGALKTKLGLESSTPSGYWTPELIKKEAEKFYLETGDISYGLLTRAHKSKLKSAIKENYQGGITALKAELGVIDRANPTGYWNDERILIYAKAFYDKFGDISFSLCAQNGEQQLYNAIRNKFPGGIKMFKEKLGIVEAQVSPDQADEMIRGLEVLP